MTGQRRLYPPRVPQTVAPRAFYSPTIGYVVVHYGRRTPVLVRTSDGEPIAELPADAVEFGDPDAPTAWAYTTTCESLARHRGRADRLEGEILAARERATAALAPSGGGTLPLSVAIDALIHLVKLGEK